MISVPLFLTPGVSAICLRPLSGLDELCIDAINTQGVLTLIKGLITGANTSTIDVAKIVTADRDRIVAALYISLYGDKIASSVSCVKCKEPFDLDFSLGSLLKHYQPADTPLPVDGIYEIEKGIRFRLPNGEDEIQLAGGMQNNVEKLLFERCLLKGNAEKNMEKVQAAMAKLAPVLNLTMQADCPECNYHQQVRFDIQSFLLMKLKQEQPQLLREIHNIASQYHWSQQSILELPRNLRKKYAALIATELQYNNG